MSYVTKYAISFGSLVQEGFTPAILKADKAWRAFLKTPEDFSGLKAIFEIQSLSIRSKVFSPKTSAKFLVDLNFFRLVSKQTKTEFLLVNSLHIK